MLTQPMKCMFRRFGNGFGYSYPIEGTIIGFAPTVHEGPDNGHCVGDKEKIKYSMDALILCNTFDKGRILQVAMWNIQVVDKWRSELPPE